ncbi:MAG: YlbF family regulator [Firmicutes bacterium]|nr:YlbF family regulator [Bacillota bacterium]
MDQKVEAAVREVVEALKQTEAYRAWVKARDDLANHHAAQVMLRDLQAVQTDLARKIESGERLSPEDEQRWQRTLETVAYNPYVRAVLEAEMAMGELLAKLHQAIAAGLGLQPEGAGTAPDSGRIPGQGPSPAASQAPPPRKSRLWVPGQP